MLSLLIFDELQLMDFSIQEDGSYKLKRYEDTGKVNLEESELLRIFRRTHKNAVDDKLIWGSHRQFAPVLYRMI